jgi:hypothetical protein
MESATFAYRILPRFGSFVLTVNKIKLSRLVEENKTLLFSYYSFLFDVSSQEIYSDSFTMDVATGTIVFAIHVNSRALKYMQGRQ